MSKNSKATQWKNNIGRMIKKKNGKGYFLAFGRALDKDKKPIGENHFPLVINEGDIIQMKPKGDDLARLVADGKMSEETATKICETVKFELSIAPAKEGQQSKASSEEVETDDEINF